MQESMTFKSTSTSGTTASKASSLFDLDENSNKGILVYRVRSGAASLDTTTEAALCAELDQHPRLPFMRVTKKPVPRGASRMDIYQEDLYMPEELSMYADKISPKTSVANVGLPSMAKWKHMVLGSYEDLYVVSQAHTPSPASSKNNSPNSSPDSSPDQSQHVSPASTFPSER